MKLKILSVQFLLCIIFISCRSKTDESNTPQISYSEDINPIITGNCSQPGCHGTLNPGTFLLTGYDNLISNGKIKPGKPQSSEIYEAITSIEEEQIMPRAPYQRLNNNQITKIYLWILQGAKNN